MAERLFKQITIGAITILIITLLGSGVYYAFLKPKPTCFDNIRNQNEEDVDCGGPCQSCEIKYLAPLDYSKEAYFIVQNNKYFIYTRILNPNAKWGVKSFKYTFTIAEADSSIKTFVGKDYILPLETKYLVLTNIALASPPISINFSIDNSSLEWAQPIFSDLPANIFTVANVRLSKGSSVEAIQNAESTLYYNFTKTLQRNSKGEEVRNLQALLAQDEDIVSKVPDLEINGVFDGATVRAVIVFQKKYGLSPQTGILDAQTIKKLNELYGRPATAPEVQQKFNFQTNLKMGMSSSEVEDLQRALSQDKTIYPEGLITGKFGYLTKRAVERFQLKYNLKVTGEVDESTRVKLNEVFRGEADSQKGEISGVKAYLGATALNNSHYSWKEVLVLGFICDQNDQVVGISKTILNNVLANSSQNFYLSWTHNLPDEIKVCQGGLFVTTNTLDASNWIK